MNNVEKMTLEQINNLLTARGMNREFARIDHARNFINKLIEEGKIKMSDIKTTEKAKAEKKPAKTVEAKKEAPTYTFAESKYNGRAVFTPAGKGVITGQDETAKRFRVKLENGTTKNYKESSVRFKAVNDQYREGYQHDRSVRTDSGSISIHCGDNVAEGLLGLSEQEVKQVALENGLETRYNGWVEKDLNAGMLRMNVGNVLRGKVRRNEQVTILGDDVKTAIAKRKAAKPKKEDKKPAKTVEAKKQKAA